MARRSKAPKKSVSERRAEARAALEDAARTLLTSDGWKAWVESNARFYRYSPNNRMLIVAQRPDATRVASYKKWADEFKRQVRKGEKGIRIFAPRIVQRTEIDPKTGEEVKRGFMYFVLVPVFDIAQTEGEPLPESPAQPLDGDSHADYLPKLEAYALSMGVSSVTYADTGAKGGWFDTLSKSIVVSSNESPNQQVHTLIHEIAHAHGVDYTDYTRAQAEVLVESVAYMVGGAIGLDTGPYSAGYVAGWGQGDDFKPMHEFALLIDSIATKIEAGIGLDIPRSKIEQSEAA